MAFVVSDWALVSNVNAITIKVRKQYLIFVFMENVNQYLLNSEGEQ